MNLKPLPYLFIQKYILLSWQDALWGYERQMISWSGIVDLAQTLLGSTSDMRVIDLSRLDKSKTHQIGELLRELATSEFETAESISAKKWLFLMLAWTFEQRIHISDPLGEIEKIYADFDYPIDIENFVRYMPAAGGYDPSQHSHEENENRLFANWEKYLNVTGSELE